MFTAAPGIDGAKAFSALLGVPLVSTEVLRAGMSRSEYFDGACGCATHLFLDPDTGVRMRRSGSKKPAAYLFGDELIQIASREPELLTLVYDQALSRGSEQSELEAKLRDLATRGLHGFAYRSHACFLLVGSNPVMVRRAHQVLVAEAHLPKDRFVFGGAA